MSQSPNQDTVLSVQGLGVSFGALKAVHDLRQSAEMSQQSSAPMVLAKVRRSI